MKKGKKIIVGYGRKSKEDKDAKGISLDNQYAECLKYAKEKGCEFVYYEDNNKTGDNLNRPEFKNMVEFIKTHKIECIVVWKLDRITRNIENYYGMIQPMLRKYNTTIASITEHFSDVFELEPMILAMYIGMAAQELKNTKKRTKSVMQYKATHGGYLGKAPIGYLNVRTDDKRGIIVPDPNKAHYVKRVFELYGTGFYSYEKIGQEMAKYGFVNSLGKPFPKNGIEKILKNPVYAGKIYYEGEYYEGNHDAIISNELYHRVQNIFNNTRKTRANVRQFTYSNYMKCAKCGCNMVGILKHGGHNSGDYVYYHCTNNRKVHTREINIKEELIDEAMQEVIDSFDITDKELKKVKNEIFKAINDVKAHELCSIKELEKEYEKLTNTIAKTTKEKLNGLSNFDETTYKELIQNWQKEKAEISCKIKNLSATSKETMTRMDILISYVKRIPELYMKATLDEKRLIVCTITDNIIFDVENKTIKVVLKPIFESLRQIKSNYLLSLDVINGTLKTQEGTDIQAYKKSEINGVENEGTGTQQNAITVEFGANFDSLKKQNVDGGT